MKYKTPIKNREALFRRTKREALCGRTSCTPLAPALDTDKDPLWTMKCIDNNVKSKKDILLTSPYSSIKLSQFETVSNKNNSEVKQNNDNQQQVNSSSRM
ncbi:DUF4806 domain-containing protein [Aphis craccivora]|uniref:DUF4806 domain-containing protein n=1 Tax=Aphis craccivora TaxID=307492 RepID=A0A6G0W363_APHCR|nr:DUF4806 domain-containing protein [Aphis craccivora]